MLDDVWEHRYYIIRCKKPFENPNHFYISGNCPDLGNWTSAKPMDFTLKKTHFEIYAHPYWEKKILLPVQREKDLNYSIYQYDASKNCFLSEDKKRVVELSLQYLMNWKGIGLWEEDLGSKSPKKKGSSVFRSPNLFKHTMIDCEKKKMRLMEPKYNSLVIYDSVEEEKAILYKINENVMLGYYYCIFLYIYHYNRE